MYAREAVNTRPSLASSLACPELNRWKRTERDGTEMNGMEQLKTRSKWSRMEGDGTDNKTERDRNGAFFLTPTVHEYLCVYTQVLTSGICTCT